jgi:acetyl esterase/lipase
VRWRGFLAVVALAGLLAGGAACGRDGSARVSAPSPAASHLADTAPYRPGLEADVYIPDRRGTVPLVVLIPGGGWVTADRAGLAPLAERLSADGMFVINATYRAAEAGVVFPTPVQDVLCATAYAVERAERAGRRPSPVVLVGHSSGAHVAALAALGAVDGAADCQLPAVAPDALAGLAGVYDISAFADVVRPLIGASPAEAPDAWHAANAMTWVTARPSLPVFLAHGYSDGLVPASFTTRFATALEDADHAVHVELFLGAGHHDLYRPDVIAAPLEAWIRTLPSS